MKTWDINSAWFPVTVTSSGFASSLTSDCNLSCLHVLHLSEEDRWWCRCFGEACCSLCHSFVVPVCKLLSSVLLQPSIYKTGKKIVWFVSATFAGYEALAGWCLFSQKVDLVLWKLWKPQTKAAQATAGHGRIQAFVCLWRVRRWTFAGFRALVFPQQSSEVHLWNKLPLLPSEVDFYFFKNLNY